MPHATSDAGPDVFPRGTLEFARVLAFSDGVFAIAMTLLVAGIAVPHVGPHDLGDALLDQRNAVFAFFLSFFVIGYYWIAHHLFFALLASVDRSLVRENVVYLGLIAFLPFPTALIGRYDQTPVAVALYAAAVALASGMETVMFRHVRRVGALRRPMSDFAYAHAMVRSLAPCAVFIGSIPIALLHPIVATASWVLLFPLERFLQRREDAGRRAYPGGPLREERDDVRARSLLGRAR
jgi:uncharacterized membrane protein